MSNPGGMRARSVLAVLLLHPGRVVPRDELIECAWETASAETDAAIAACLYRLREAVDPTEQDFQLRSVGGGFLAEFDPMTVDVHRFLALLEPSGTGPAAGLESAGRLRRAVALWQGHTHALIDVQSTWLREQARILEGRRLDALEQLTRLELDTGHPQQAVELLRETTSVPERENLTAIHIRALLSTGQTSEATELARVALETLGQQGRQPGPALRTALDTALGLHPDARPTGVPRGSRQLPADTAFFTGRGEQLGNLLASADRTGDAPGTVVISAIDGMGGVGKTALAVHAGRLLAEQFPDGQLFVDLHGFTQDLSPRAATDVLADLLRTLDVHPSQIPEDLDARAALYRDRLYGKRMLVVLDNARSEEQVRPLLPGHPGCCLSTSCLCQMRLHCCARSRDLGGSSPKTRRWRRSHTCVVCCR
jgi:DNA-binding SARP family transcriptional activator